MHTTEIGGTANVPAFLTKLWKLVEDPTYEDLITWSQNGRSFIIKNQSRFSKELLPLYFKHNNMASFIRQLNMYGFRKLTSIENSGLKSDKDDMEFFHQYFLKGQENYLEFIKRKVATNGKPNGSIGNIGLDPDHGGFKGEEYREILMDVKAIRDRQDTAENCLVQMQRENSALWREVAVLRQKHAKQQQVVERLIHFLVTLVQKQRIHPPSMKRKIPLMIDDGLDGSTCAKRGPQSPTSGAIGSPTSGAIGGPVIHDVTNDVIDAELDAAANSDPIISMKDVKDDNPSRPTSVGINISNHGNNNGNHGNNSFMTVSSPIQFIGNHSDPFEDILNTVSQSSPVTDGAVLSILSQSSPVTDGAVLSIPDLDFASPTTPSTGPSTPQPSNFDVSNGISNPSNSNGLHTPLGSIPSPPLLDPVSVSAPSVSPSPLLDSVSPSPLLDSVSPSPLLDSVSVSASQSQPPPSKSPQPTLHGMEMVPSTSSPSSSLGLPNFTKLPTMNGPNYSREYFTDHVDGVDTELSWLQDQLSAGSISIDPNALLGLFATEGEIQDSESTMGIQFGENDSKGSPETGL